MAERLRRFRPDAAASLRRADLNRTGSRRTGGSTEYQGRSEGTLRRQGADVRTPSQQRPPARDDG